MIVRLISRPALIREAIEEMGYIFHEEGTVSPGDELSEIAGRECYQSWKRPNPATATNQGYLDNILVKRHVSVMDHANYVFSIREVSRSLTHELIRHRHFGYSQVSQRYVDEASGSFVIPPELTVTVDGEDQWDLLLADEHHDAITLYERIVTKLVNNGVPRKRARQAARYVLPNGHTTRLIMSGNIRAWRELIEKRIARDPETMEPLADLEIHQLATRILVILHEEVPNAVQDLWAANSQCAAEGSEGKLACNTIGTHRKKPVVITAVRWTGENLPDIIAFLGDSYVGIGSDVYIRTLEGTMHASIGDWIIRGVEGEHYACKPAIFDATYETVEL